MSDILNQHSYHPATPQTAPLHDDIRQWCIGLAQQIERLVPDGPEKDEAQKALHIVRMWANMGIAVRSAPVATEQQRATPQPTHGQGHSFPIVDLTQDTPTSPPFREEHIGMDFSNDKGEFAKVSLTPEHAKEAGEVLIKEADARTPYSMRKFTCPNCGEQVQGRERGHINPHWEDTPYGKTEFTCQKRNADESLSV